MQADVQQVLTRSLVDDDFLDQMLNDPEQALQQYDLTDDERAILTSRKRNLLDLMRISGTAAPGFNVDVTIIISIILDLSLDLTLDLTLPEVARSNAARQSQIASLATSVLAARSGANRLERLQQLLQSVSGAALLASRSAGGPSARSG